MPALMRRERPDADLVARLIAAGAVAGLASLPFLLILLLVEGQAEALERFDLAVANELNAWALTTPTAVTILEVLERVTSPWSFRLLVLFVAGLLWRAGSRRLATWAVMTMAVGGLLNVALKEAVARARPTFPDPVSSADHYSFPSGHAQNSVMGVAVLLLILLPLLHRRGKVLAWVVGAAIVLITGFDRIALGVHYISDVVAGWIVGLAVVVGTCIAFDTRRHRHRLTQGLEPAGSRRLTEHGDEDEGEHSREPVQPDTRALLRELRGLASRLLVAAAGIWLTLVALGALVAVLDDVIWPLTRDEAIVQQIAEGRTATWNAITAWISWLADTPRTMISLAIVAVVFRLLFGRWRESAFVVAAVTIQAVAFVGSAAIVSRSRPDVVQLDASPPTASFPSGHAGAALALYLSVALVLAWHPRGGQAPRVPLNRLTTRRHWLKVLIWLLLLIPPACVAYARVYRGMHYPSDIIGSVLNAGLSIAVAARALLFASLPPQLHDVLDRPHRRQRIDPRSSARTRASQQVPPAVDDGRTVRRR